MFAYSYVVILFGSIFMVNSDAVISRAKRQGGNYEVNVVGNVLCSMNKGQEGETKLDLWDEVRLAPDRQLATAFADVDGHFEIRANAHEQITEPRLYLIIRYRCGGNIEKELRWPLEKEMHGYVAEVKAGIITLPEEAK
ncbi:transthyretin-like family domain-containing protein [Ditylenchus destructor]|uniref:Transthyretin-like family domain-containing protein n=1 Tax=Ditylenchus destructor TaxID=166010 RepID=A0AAD4MT17_9BILA|nr:transthyretin-like family domain-containing protein [Ditylenchus destructor]